MSDLESYDHDGVCNFTAPNDDGLFFKSSLNWVTKSIPTSPP